jgi:hypothetical protein
MEAGVPNDDRTQARFQAYWEAIRQHVCGVCLDQRDDGECGLRHRTCALQAHLPRLVEVLAAVQSTRMDEYEAAVRAEICAGCPSQDADSHCPLREKSDCALFTYLPLVLEAVEGVNERLPA